MKAGNVIKDKLRQAIFRHRKKHIRRVVRRCPDNCRFNRELNLPEGSTLGICGHSWEGDGEWPGVCDEQHGGDNQASVCSRFENRYDKDVEKLLFREFFATASLAEIAARYPDVAALMWVIGADDNAARDVEIPDNEDWEPTFPEHALEIFGIPVHVKSEDDLRLLSQHLASYELSPVEYAGSASEVSEPGLLQHRLGDAWDLARCPTPGVDQAAGPAVAEEVSPPSDEASVSDRAVQVRHDLEPKGLFDRILHWWCR